MKINKLNKSVNLIKRKKKKERKRKRKKKNEKPLRRIVSRTRGSRESFLSILSAIYLLKSAMPIVVQSHNASTCVYEKE